LHPVNSPKDKARLFSSGDFYPPETVFEFNASRLDDRKDVIDIRPGVVFSFVPPVGALFQSFIVPFLVRLYQTFQADVSPDLKPKMVTLQEQKKTGDTPVSVTEGMDTEKIKVEGCHEHGMRNLPILDSVIIKLY
jgi:hypothetical protein